MSALGYVYYIKITVLKHEGINFQYCCDAHSSSMLMGFILKWNQSNMQKPSMIKLFYIMR